MEALAPLDTGAGMMAGACLLRLLRVVVLLALWRTIFARHGTIAGMSIEAVLTYTLVSSAFKDQLDVSTKAQDALWKGGIALYFLRPMRLFGQFAAQTFGSWILPFFVYAVPLFLIAPLLGVQPLPANLHAGFWFVPSLALAISAGFAIDFIFLSLTVACGHNIWIFVQIREAAGMLLSGALIPLALFPWGIGRVFDWLPFAAAASAPLRIYTGTGDVFALLAMQAAWSLALWPLAHWMWRLNRERLVSHGG